MPNLPQKKATKADFAVLILMTAITLFSGAWFPSRSTRKPETFSITSGSVTTFYPLTENAAFTVESEGITLIVTVDAEERSVSVTDSDCPDHVCQNTGAVSRPGQTIVCVPAKTVIQIGLPDAQEEGDGENADFIIG